MGCAGLDPWENVRLDRVSGRPATARSLGVPGLESFVEATAVETRGLAEEGVVSVEEGKQRAVALEAARTLATDPSPNLGDDEHAESEDRGQEAREEGDRDHEDKRRHHRRPA